jgi:hypothetical protein
MYVLSRYWLQVDSISFLLQDRKMSYKLQIRNISFTGRLEPKLQGSNFLLDPM